MGMNQVRILVADDSQMMCAAYNAKLETRENILVIGMAYDGLEALENTAELISNVAILE